VERREGGREGEGEVKRSKRWCIFVTKATAKTVKEARRWDSL
jgi:hypothetical protein